MAQQGKQMRVGACEGSAYQSEKLVLLANNNSRYEFDFFNVFLSCKAIHPLLFCPKFDLFYYFF
jgi:hypothetical protein